MRVTAEGAAPTACGARRIAGLEDCWSTAAVEPVLVDGVLCPRMHVNEPDARDCRECGIVLAEGAPRIVRRHPRPPLGVLLVDGGRRYPLDRNYVIGREPVLDGDVTAGRATPVKISDPKGTISRLHLRVALSGWQVEITDLGRRTAPCSSFRPARTSSPPTRRRRSSPARGSVSGTASSSSSPSS